MKTYFLKLIIVAFQIILIVISLITLLPFAKAQTNRRIQISETPKSPPLTGRYYALLIAVSDFAPNSGLDYPLQDAERVRQVLTTRYAFEPGNVTHLRRAIALAPGVAGPHYTLGLTLLSQKKFVEAEVELGAALPINPYDPQAREA